MLSKSKIVFEIGNDSVKLVETSYDKANGKLILYNFAILPLVESGSKTLTEHDPVIVAEIVKKELSKKDWKAKEAYAVLSGEGIIARDILVDKVSEKELDNKVKNDSLQYLPVDLSNYVVDYKVLAEIQTPEGPKYKVYIVAVPQKNIDSYIELADRCRLTMEVIDINGNALSKLLVQEMKKNNQVLTETDAVVGLDIGAKGAYIVFVQNGVFQFTREINFGGMDIINILSEYLGVDITQAEEMLKKNPEKYVKFEDEATYDDEETTYIGKDIMKRMNGFAFELGKIISFYQTRYNCKNIPKIYLTGGTSSLRGLCEFISANTRSECEKLNQLKCMQVVSNKKLNDEISILANIIGASIR